MERRRFGKGPGGAAGKACVPCKRDGKPRGREDEPVDGADCAAARTFSIGVIEGDIAGQIDAEKIAALEIPAAQLDTDGACHIEAMSIQNLLPAFDLDALDVLFVENVGNLVCPAEFDIGENFRLTLLSVPEGDDKVAKYPLMFTDTDCLVVTKCDVLPYFSFDKERVAADYRAVNPEGPLFCVSTKTGDGMEALAAHLSARIREALA